MELQQPQPQTEEPMTDEQALLKIAQAMKDNAPTQEEKSNVHTFLRDVVMAKDTTKIGNLRVDKDLDELGIPAHTVRGCKEMSRISGMIINNEFFKGYFKSEAEDTLATSLSREGFLVRTSTIQTKQIVDATRRKKSNKGWFGKKSTDESGGDITQTN